MTKQQIIEAIKSKGGDLPEQAIDDIVRLCDRWEKEQKRPLYLYCIVSGTQCAMTAKALWNKRYAGAGGNIFNLMTSYIGKSGRKKAKQPAPKSKQDQSFETDDIPDTSNMYRQFKTTMQDGSFDWVWRDPEFHAKLFPTSKPSNHQQIYHDITKDTCIRVDLAANRQCDQCEHRGYCQVQVKPKRR